MGPLISVIIPVYQVKKYIKTCVDSVLAQTYEQLEIILIDDGSTDGSGEICDAYARQDARIQVIHQSNAGLAAARNAGIDACQGSWITFVDSDDLIGKNMIAGLYEQAIRTGAELCVCSWMDVGEEAGLSDMQTQQLPAEVLVLPKEEAMKKMLYQQGTDSCAWAKLYQRELFKTLRFPEGKLFEDIAVMYDILQLCGKVCFISERSYFYRQRKASIMTADFSPAKMDLIDLTDQLNQWILQNHPLLADAAASRRVRANFTIYMQIPRRPEYRSFQQRIEENIKKHRKQVLEDQEAKRGTKLAILLTYLGFPLFYRLRGLAKLGKK